MKYCLYCNTTYTLAETDCPSCGAVDFEIKCDNCGAIHKEGTGCPNCGFKINDKPSYCPKCGYQTRARVCPRCGHDVAAASTVTDAVASVASKAACKFTGHKWVGCKCTRCGETRDDGHEFHPIAGKCEQKCSICGKTESLLHQWNGEKCSRCGAVKGNADKFWSSVGNRLPFLHLEKTNNTTLVVLVLSCLLILIFVFIGIMALQESKPNGNGEILLPHTSQDFAGENYHNIVDELQEAGFTNIKTQASGDLITGWLNKDGDVDTVAVAGNTDYNTNKRYSKDVEIVITYHSFPIKENETSQPDASVSTSEVVLSTSQNSPQESNPPEVISTYKYSGPLYEIVDTCTTGIGLTNYWVYTDGFDYSTDAFREKIKAIITDVARNQKTDKLEVNIVTDKEIIYFESDNTIEEYMDKYGMDYFENTIAPKEDTDWVCGYIGGYDSDASEKSDEDSAFEIWWFIAEHTDRDDVVIELWKPDLTS